jgi:hypothetical protein
MYATQTSGNGIRKRELCFVVLLLPLCNVQQHFQVRRPGCRMHWNVVSGGTIFYVVLLMPLCGIAATLSGQEAVYTTQGQPIIGIRRREALLCRLALAALQRKLVQVGRLGGSVYTAQCNVVPGAPRRLSLATQSRFVKLGGCILITNQGC